MTLPAHFVTLAEGESKRVFDAPPKGALCLLGGCDSGASPCMQWGFAPERGGLLALATSAVTKSGGYPLR